MATFSILISGISPLLLHRFTEAAEQPSNRRNTHVKPLDPRVAAEAAAYRNEAGELWFPGMAIARLLREAASAYKQRGSRRSLKYVIAGAVIVNDDQILLRDSQGQSLTTFEVDSRPVVIPATKGRVMRHRPRFNAWNAEFSVRVDDEIIDPDTVHQCLIDGGTRIGIGDFRPEKGGPFGQYHVTRWQVLAQKGPKRLAA